MPPKTKPAIQPPRPTPPSTSSSNSGSPSNSCGAAGGGADSGTPPHPDFKAELLSSLRVEMAAIFKTELQAALTENLSNIKTELRAVKSELSDSITNIQSDVCALKSTVGEMETSLSSCTDDVATLQAKVEHLTKELTRLDNKCEDLEARSRRNNIRLVGIPEDFSISSTATAISSLLKEALKLEKEPLVDRAHRTLQPKPKPGERPRAIVARLHYHTDCVEILRRARAQQRIKIGDMTFSIFPDHTPRTARARAAFNDVRRQLREIPGIRFGLLYPARLRVTHNGAEKEFKSPEEASAFIRSLDA